jgi:molybdate transport system substrate-binding protein
MHRGIVGSRWGLCLIALVCAAGCSEQAAPPDDGAAAAPQAEVVVFAAASMVVALDPIAAKYEADTGTKVSIGYASSSALAQQIQNGAPARVFISADPAWAGRLQDSGHAAQRVDFLGNSLVLVVPATAGDAVKTLEDLKGDAVQHIAIGDPATVPAGQYAKEALVTSGLWESLGPKIVPGMDVRQALLYVERGDAEAGIVYATDAKGSSAVRVVTTLDDQLKAPVRYSLVLTAQGKQDRAAADFFKHLLGDEAMEAFEASGFSRVTGPANPDAPQE